MRALAGVSPPGGVNPDHRFGGVRERRHVRTVLERQRVAARARESPVVKGSLAGFAEGHQRVPAQAKIPTRAGDDQPLYPLLGTGRHDPEDQAMRIVILAGFGDRLDERRRKFLCHSWPSTSPPLYPT